MNNVRPPTDEPGVFAGREGELAQGFALLDAVVDGRGAVLLVAGEPGIGKSRFADELSTAARQRGVQVAWGRCWEAGGAPAYWPWIQALRTVAGAVERDALQSMLGRYAADLAQLLPDSGIDVAPPSLTSDDPEVARFRLFDGTSALLRARAAQHPLMLVLDDLQEADEPSLLLLRFLAATVSDNPLLIVATYRETELEEHEALAKAVAALMRVPSVRRVRLHGISSAAVSQLIESATGVAPAPELVEAVHAETEGNPLFVQEVARLLFEEGRISGANAVIRGRVEMPRTVREVIARRLQHLDQASIDALRVASVLGRDFAIDTLARLAGIPVDTVRDLLEAPLAARVLTDVPGARGRTRFAHVVIRECLYDDLGTATRTELHRRAASLLETLYVGDIDSHLSEIAHHYLEGASRGDADKAVEYARRAGDKANAMLAYEEAVRMYRMALEGMTLRAPDPVERCELLLALGDAQSKMGDEDAYRRTFLEAASRAAELGLSELHARAALGYGGRLVWVRAGSDTRLIPLLKDGLEAIGDRDPHLRVRLLARLAGASRDEPASEPRESAAREAVALAGEVGDPATLAYALDGLYAALWKPDTPHERLYIAAEMLKVAEQAGDIERIIAGHRYRAFAFLELGDRDGMLREAAALERSAAELGQPVDTWWAVVVRSLIALVENRLDDAERLVESALPLGLRAVRLDAAATHHLHLFQIRRAQGRVAEMQAVIRDSAREYTWYPMFRCALVLLYCDLGAEAAARVEFDLLADDGFACVPFDNLWLFSLAMLCEAARALGDADRAETLHELLLPYADRLAFGTAEGIVGPVARYLGLAAATASRPDEARRHFQAAIEIAARMRAPGWLAQAKADLDALPLGAVDSVSAGHQTSGRESRAQRASDLRKEGEYWSVEFEGVTTLLRDSKGVRVLAELLATPNRPWSALDLERLGAPGDDATARAIASGDAGALLDETAKREYRARLKELSEDIDDAEQSGDAPAVAALKAEKDIITSELHRALGLGGRSRVAGSIGERARLNVTRALRSTLRRIAASAPELATHLDATVRTGTVCVYTPDPRAHVEWRVSRDPVRRS